MSVFVSVVGRSNSGKAALVEKLIVEIKRRGHTLAAVKHCGGDFQFDRPGKDNWRPTEAGGNVMERPAEPLTLDRAVALLRDRFDFTLVEGFKEKAPSCARSGIPKVEVHRKESGSGVSPPEGLFALVADEELGLPVSHFSSSHGVELADLLVGELGGTRR